MKNLNNSIVLLLIVVLMTAHSCNNSKGLFNSNDNSDKLLFKDYGSSLCVDFLKENPNFKFSENISNLKSTIEFDSIRFSHKELIICAIYLSISRETIADKVLINNFKYISQHISDIESGISVHLADWVTRRYSDEKTCERLINVITLYKNINAAELESASSDSHILYDVFGMTVQHFLNPGQETEKYFEVYNNAGPSIGKNKTKYEYYEARQKSLVKLLNDDLKNNNFSLCRN